MAVTGLRWSDWGARDIHLTPGLASPLLIQSLLVYDDGAGDWFPAHKPPAGVRFGVTFRAAFAGAPSGHGVRVHGQTGEVTVASSLPLGPRLRSFLVTATVNQGTGEWQTRVRVYVHESVQTRWLTPSTLRVRRGAANMRFSVLARFDDGVIGDISNWSPLDTPEPGELTFVHRSGSTDPVHRWSPRRGDPSTAMYVDPVTGEIGCEDETAQVKVSVQVDLGNPLASAIAAGAPAWTTGVRVTPVAGPGFAAMEGEDIHNVLFLPDGFVDDPTGQDRADFERYVRTLVNELNTNSQTRPFDVLASKFNYFSAWVPSPEAGVSALAEHYTLRPDGGHLVGRAVELPVAASGAPAELDLPELIDTVGLPTPVFDPPGSPAGTDAAGRVHDWQRLYGQLPTLARTTDVYPEWLRRGDRLLINERNTAFHVADDYRPRVDETGNTVAMAFHPLRLVDRDFDAFLNALQDDQGSTLPVLWPTGGKDASLIVILCRTRRSGGMNVSRGAGGHYIGVSLDDRTTHQYLANPNGDGYDLVPDSVPADVGLGAWATVAHELAHSFTLNDEYGGGADLPGSALESVGEASNVQEREALLNDDGDLVADDIKWRWPRLRQAGLLADRPDGSAAVRPDPARAGQFLLNLAPGHARAFAHPEVDIVQLRERDLRAHPDFSDRLRVTDVRGDQLTVRLIAGARLDPDAFGDGDLVVAPVRADDPDLQNDVLGANLELVSALAIDRINATHNPLNAAADDEPGRDCPGSPEVPTPATNFAPGTEPARPRLSYRLVGLYEGGHGYDCGIYHPTGLCVMNRTTTRSHGRRRINLFCPVCRYAMVDLIDPAAHGAIDADYDYDFPR